MTTTFPRKSIANTVRYSMIVTGLLLTGHAAADGQKEYVATCDHNHCLITYQAQDSDGDGVSDQDELAAGTNPYDPASRPPVLQLTDMAANLKLPSAWAGLSEILVLPTQAPDGTALFGGIAALPSRGDTLSRLGISSSLLAGLGVDIAGGVRITLDHPKSNASLGGVSARVAGLPMAQISGGTVMPPLIESGGGKKVDFSGTSTTRDGNTTISQTQVYYTDGTGQTYTTMAGKGSATTDVQEHDASGHTTGGQSETVTHQENPDGGHTNTSTTTTSDGQGHQTSSTYTSQTTHPGGQVDYATSTTNTTYDDKGNATSATNVTETGSCSDQGCSGEKTTTTCGADASSCSSATEPVKTDGGYYDPAYQESVVVVDAALMEQVLATLGSTVHTMQNVEVPVGDPAQWHGAAPGGPLVILVDPDYAEIGTIAIGPIDFNRIGGNVDRGHGLPSPGLH